MRNRIKKHIAILLAVCILITPMYIFGDEASGGASNGLTVETSAAWTNDEKTTADIYVTAKVTSTPSTTVPNSLFVGSLCTSHGMIAGTLTSPGTVESTINAMAQKANVTYYACDIDNGAAANKQGVQIISGPNIQKNGTINKGNSINNRTFTYKGANHCNQCGFETALYNELILNDTYYDYIVLEFDSFEESTSEHFRFQSGSKLTSLEKNKLADTLKSYYENNKVFWISSYKNILNYIPSELNYILKPSGSSQNYSNIVQYSNLEEVTNFVEAIEIWPSYKLSFTDAIDDDWEINGATLQILSSDGNWYDAESNISIIDGVVTGDIPNLQGPCDVRLAVHIKNETYKDSSVPGTNTIDPAKAGEASVSMTSGEETITETATFEESEEPLTWEAYEIITSADGNGVIDETKVIAEGLDATIEYSANAHAKLNELIVDGSNVSVTDNATSYTFTNVQENHTIKAFFSIIEHYITTFIDHGIITDSQYVNDGEDFIITFLPALNYEVQSVKVNGVETPYDTSANSITLHNVSADASVGVFCTNIPFFNVRTNITNGVISSDALIIRGGSCTIGFHPNAGFKVSKVIVNSSDASYNQTNNTITLSDIREDKNVSVICEKIDEPPAPLPTYNVETKIYNGTITRSKTVASGSNMKVSFEPYQHFETKAVMVNGTPQEYEASGDGGSFMLQSINENKDVVVSCEEKKYLITTEVKHGKISDDIEVSEGEDAMILFSPKKGYRLRSITVDGKLVKIRSKKTDNYTFKNVTQDHEISVVYKKIKPFVGPVTGDPSLINLYIFIFIISTGLLGFLLLSFKFLNKEK